MRAPSKAIHSHVASSNIASQRQGSKLSVPRKILLVLFLVSIYLEVPLNITSSFFIPSFITLLFLAPVVGLMYHKKIYKYEAVFVGQVFFVLSLTAFLSPGLEHVDQKFLGLVQTMASIVSGILLIKLLSDLRSKWVARVLLVLSVLLLVAASLEVVGVLRGASDAFREAVYNPDGGGHWGVYESNMRDMSMTGFLRPKVFTSEPSLLAIGFFAFVNSWLLLAYNVRNLIATCVGTLLMLALTGSPVLILALLVSLLIALHHRNGAAGVAVAAGFAVSAGLVLVFVESEIASSLSARFDDAVGYYSTLNPSSQDLRVVFPFITLVDVVQASPLFGVGISGKEVIDRYSSLPVDPKVALGTSAFAAFFIYLGVLGTLLFAKVFHVYLRRMRIQQAGLLLILIVAFSLMIGGFEAPRYWGYVFLFIGVMKLRSDTRDGRLRTSRGDSRKAPGSYTYESSDSKYRGTPL